jgi:P4 family phage/plasmid primase-like protien
MEGRYDYIPADSNSGVVVYDSKFAYSHHATDPASEKLLNAFDLVRIHKFGDMDDKASFTAMSEFALSVPKVKAEMSEMARVAAAVEFAGNASEDDPYPFIVVGARGGAKVSPPKLAGHFRDSHDYFLTKGQSGGMQLWVYDGSVYARTSELELKGILMRYVGDFDPDLIKMKDMAEAASQIMADDKIRSITELDADENIVVMENGLYNIATGVLSPHTPNHIGSIKIPVRWNATANKANVFNRFLCELTGGDPEKIQFLKEFIGIALSNVKGYKTKKALFLVGEGNTGKSQLRSLVERLIGIENCTSVALEVLERRFGTGLVFGKRLVGSNDLGFADIPELQVFKQLTGGDSMLMENKFADGFTAVYNGVLWFSMNRLPSFGGDRGGHVFERIVIIECGEPCPPEKQDRGLLEKMYAERDGIVAECFAAASVVIGRGYKYTLPKASASANEQYKKEVSTVKTFASEYCEAITAEVSAGIKSSELYRQYRGWCFDSGYHPSSAKVFTREAAELFGMRPKLFKIHKQDGDYYRLKYRGRAKDDFTPIPGERGDGDGTDAIIEDDLPF